MSDKNNRSPKPFKSWTEQRDSISQKMVPGRLSEQFLKANNYYRLSGYWFPLRELIEPRSSRDSTGREIRAEHFQQSYSFDQVLYLYEWEVELRTVLFRLISKIELALRAQVANRLGSYSPFAHRNPALFRASFSQKANLRKRVKFYLSKRRRQRTSYDQWLLQIAHAIERETTSDDAIRHQIEKYGDVHIWSLVEIFEFNTLITAFKNLRNSDTGPIAQFFGYNAKHVRDLVSQLEAMNTLRNKIAHHSRIWNRNFARTPKLPPPSDYPLFQGIRAENRHDQYKLFPMLCTIAYILSIVESTWSARDELMVVLDGFPDDGAYTLSSAGFPPNWRKLPIWASGT